MQDFERLNSGEDISMPSEDDALEPNHYLSVLRQHMKSPPLLRNWRSDYAGLADSKGTSGIETTIIQSLDSRLRLLVETGLLDLESLGGCNGLNPRDTERPGVYIHVMYNPMDHSIVGAYTGQAMNMSRRISEHEKALENAQNGKLGRGKKAKERLRKETRHINFWQQSRILDFWLVFGLFDRPAARDELEELGLFMNVLEMYAALIFRLLPRPLLRLNLPKNADMAPYGPYPWEGLNVQEPMQQPLNHLGQSNAGPKGKYERRWRPFVIQKEAKGKGSFWRYADVSERDEACVKIQAEQA